MLIRHSLVYLLARGLPGLVNLAALALYSRLLTAEDFGMYSLVVAGVSMASVICFQWQWLVLARWLPSRAGDSPRFLGEVLHVFAALAGVTISIGILASLFWHDPAWQKLIAVAVPLLVAQSWMELNLVLASAQLAPRRYGLMLGLRTVTAISVGAVLAWVGFGAFGPLMGLMVGFMVAVPVFGLAPWRNVRPRRPDWPDLRAQLHYGLPLIATFALSWVIASSDRLLIAWLLSVEAAGQYAVGYDLAQQSLGALLAVAQVAAYPLLVRALENDGPDVAVLQMRKSAELIVTLACTGGAGLMVLSGPISIAVVGAQFQQAAGALVPWIALSTALMGIKTFHFDMAFHLGRNTRYLVGIGLAAAMINVALNVVLIPRFGLLGAAYATVAAYSVGTLISALLGRQVFTLPRFLPVVARAMVIAIVTAGAASIGPMINPGLPGLAVGISCGAATSLALAFVIDLGGLRTDASRWWTSRLRTGADGVQ
ncbi:MAG: oligosaccharide flippase family protein [Burkholderiaceae bacterium]|nr:oligosaccharide flippase family protein [Burkholderiaceae bacterium]